MPEITVTETQRERLETIEGELEAAYIDTYGHIRTTDVVQYLLDTYTPPEQRGSDVGHERIATADFGALQSVASDVEGVPGSGIDTETMRGELLSALGVEEFAVRLAEIEAGGDSADTGNGGDSGDATSEDTESEPDDMAADSDEAPANGSAADGESADADEDATDTDDTDGDDEPESDETESGPTPGSGGPGSVLSAANQLLTDHEDKWREGEGEEPYEVDLPDGTTETVRTKDDVRGLLFKHY